MTNTVSTFGSTELSEILTKMNTQGGFQVVVLADQQGFPIASAATPGQDPELQSAMVALIQKTATQVCELLGMAQTDELSLNDSDGRRFVCRPFEVDGRNMILAVLVPDKRQSYRRLANTAVNAIQRQWQL